MKPSKKECFALNFFKHNGSKRKLFKTVVCFSLNQIGKTLTEMSEGEHPWLIHRSNSAENFEEIVRPSFCDKGNDRLTHILSVVESPDAAKVLLEYFTMKDKTYSVEITLGSLAEG